MTVKSGPSFTTRREEAASQMMQLVQAFPDAAPIIGDLIAKNLDWPGADDIADRLKAMLPPQIQKLNEGEDEIPPEIKQVMDTMQQQMQQMQQAIQQGTQAYQQLQAENQNMKMQLSNKAGDIEVKGMDNQVKNREIDLKEREIELKNRELSLQEQQLRFEEVKAAYGVIMPEQTEQPNIGN